MLDAAAARILIDTAIASGEVQVINERDGIVLIPKGHGNVEPKAIAELLDPYRETPRFKVANVSLVDAASFVEYFKRYETEASMLFANNDPADLGVTAIFDYHGAGSDAPAGWRKHTAKFKLAPTQEWADWRGKNSSHFSQESFAEFIEDHTAQIWSEPGSKYPDGATMLAVAESLKMEGTVSYHSGKNLANGNISFKYTEEGKATGGGNIEVPQLFQIRLKPYQGTGVVTITARLRFRIKDKQLIFFYVLNQPHKVEETAFEDAITRISAETQKTILIGKLG